MELLTLMVPRHEKWNWRIIALLLNCFPVVSAYDDSQAINASVYLAVWLTLAFSITCIITTVIVGFCLYLRIARVLPDNEKPSKAFPSKDEIVKHEERNSPPLTKPESFKEDFERQLDMSNYSASDNLYIPTTHLYEVFVNNSDIPRRHSVIQVTPSEVALNEAPGDFISSEQHSALYDNVNRI